MNLGTKFIPTDKMKHDTFIKDIESYKRKIRLSLTFNDTDNPPNPNQNNGPNPDAPNPDIRYCHKPVHYKFPYGLIPKQFYLRNSSFDPILPSHYNTLVKEMNERCNQLTQDHIAMIPTKNLNDQQQLTLRTLISDKQIIIRNADKNLGLTIMTKDWYYSTIWTMMKDHRYYKLTHNWDTVQYWTTDTFVRLTNDFRRLKNNLAAIIGLKHFISKYLDNYDYHDRPAHFYIIPKIHKTPVKGRPIVSAVGYITTPISTVLNYILKDYLKKFNTICNNSTHLIQRYEGTTIPPGYLWLSADVESLYTNINLTKLIDTIQTILNEDGNINPNIRSWTITALKWVLYNNYFLINGNIFLQIHGIAMGTSVAPILANLYLAFMERHNFIQQLPLYMRYLDDVIALWPTGQDPALLHHHFNNQDSYITFTTKVDQLSIDFLDLTAHKSIRNTIYFTLYKKSINRYLYLPFQSEHTLATKRGFIKGELIRLARNNTIMSNFNRNRKEFYSNLRSRGYPIRFLQKAFGTISYNDRRLFLTTTTPKSFNHITLPLCFTNSILELNPKLTLTKIYFRLWQRNHKSKQHRIAWKKHKNVGEQFAKAYKLEIDNDMEHYNRKFIQTLSSQNIDLHHL